MSTKHWDFKSFKITKFWISPKLFVFGYMAQTVRHFNQGSSKICDYPVKICRLLYPYLEKIIWRVSFSHVTISSILGTNLGQLIKISTICTIISRILKIQNFLVLFISFITTQCFFIISTNFFYHSKGK